ncbi:NUDIX domain-containing protein [Clostridium tagluense]|uniref:U8 snoRNA-decapping enzyme n=1 Tax=Clostridium tagluense TaxID=360422 RepID=A0A401USW4_9CLOT|nr:NUDIX hydrolase [Clostridium tagluense]GCD12649.1 hypothetical protein Ctaglu_42720 [Clostridium tagluense]
MYNLVETGSIRQDKQNCVFASIFCRNANPYKRYEEVEGLEVRIPLVLMQMRWDGGLGFVGGKVDKEDKINGMITQEVLKNALIREVKEEINLDLLDRENLKPLCTYQDKNVDIHNFSLEVSEEIFYFIFKNSVNSEHMITENSGNVVCHVANYKDDKGYQRFIENRFCATSLMELKHLIEQEKLLVSF